MANLSQGRDAKPGTSSRQPSHRKILIMSLFNLRFICVYCLILTGYLISTISVGFANPTTDQKLKGSEELFITSTSRLEEQLDALVKLDPLDEFTSTLGQIKKSELPSILSVFVLKSDGVNTEAGPKVMIRSIHPLKMTFFFTFQFGTS